MAAALAVEGESAARVLGGRERRGYRMWRLRLVSIAAVCAAVAMLWPSRIFPIGWSHALAERVVLTPTPMWALRAVGLTLAGFALLSWAWRQGGRPPESLAAFLTPALALGVLLVPFLPLVGDALPHLNMLAGPLRWGVVAAVVAACLWPSCRSGSRHGRASCLPASSW